MESRSEARAETEVIGIEVRTINREEMDPATARIGGLWERYFGDDVAARVPNRKPGGALLAVYTRYESDHTGPYSLIVGPEVTSLAVIPEGMTGTTVPAGRYRVFEARGPMPKALIDTWAAIWSYFPTAAGEERAFNTDYEIHLEGGGGADICIAVR
jgi:predicted transcriptional regulator YdeE